MSDRYHALTVVLESNLRDDDASPIIEAIKMIRGVVTVSPHVADPDTYAAQERARRDLLRKILEVIE